jgi:hypothetical protein
MFSPIGEVGFSENLGHYIFSIIIESFGISGVLKFGLLVILVYWLFSKLRIMGLFKF